MASSTRLVKLSHGGVEKTLALYAGLEPSELNSLLSAIFSLPPGQQVVGITTDSGLAIPTSLACRNPDVVPLTKSTLIVSDASPRVDALPPPPPSAQVAPRLAATQSALAAPGSASSLQPSANTLEIFDVISRFASNKLVTSRQESILKVKCSLPCLCPNSLPDSTPTLTY